MNCGFIVELTHASVVFQNGTNDVTIVIQDTKGVSSSFHCFHQWVTSDSNWQYVIFPSADKQQVCAYSRNGTYYGFR